MGSRFLAPTTPGGLLSIIGAMLTSDEVLIIQAIENGTYFYINIVPTGAINGVNTTYTLPNTPNPASKLEVYIGGVKQTLTTDYSSSGTTLTMVIPPTAIVTTNFLVSPV